MAGEWASLLLQALGGDTEPEPEPKLAVADVYEQQLAAANAQAAAQMQLQAHAALRDSSEASNERRLEDLQNRHAALEAQMQALRSPQPSSQQTQTSPVSSTHGASGGTGLQQQHLQHQQQSRSRPPPYDPGEPAGLFRSWDAGVPAASSGGSKDDPEDFRGKGKSKGKGKDKAANFVPQLQQMSEMFSNPRPAVAGTLENSTPSFGGNSSTKQFADAAAAKANPDEDPERLRCHLHKKPHPACKFCSKYVSAKKEAENKAKQSSQTRDVQKKEVFNCSPLLKDQVLQSSYYRSLTNIVDIGDFVREIQQYAADTMDVYKNTMEPSCFMCCAYRLYTLSLPDEELRMITDNQESPLVRCVGFVFIRYVALPEELWDKLEEFILDDEKIFVTDGGNTKGIATTIGEYIEGLLLKDKYMSTPLPRIPNAVRRKLEERIAPMLQYRKRTKANRRVFKNGLPEFNMSVEACIGGVWHEGRATEILNRIPSRLKVRVHLHSGEEHIVHIGKVILSANTVVPVREPSRSRSRSPSNDPSQTWQRDRSPDWSRCKGKSDASMVEDLRGRAREDAVCSDRKEYAKRLPRYEQTLAIRREQGSQEARLIEEETYITMERRRRAREETQDEADERERIKSSRTDAEIDRQQKMKDIFEKYGQQKSLVGTSKTNDLEGPDTLRLG